MRTLIINTESEVDLNFLQTLIAKLGFKSTVLSDDEKENIAMLKVMQEVENTKVYNLNEAEVVYKSLKKAK
jgi:hypothetical protein